MLPDFVLLTQLERALNLGGILGPVEFTMRDGVYDEQISIGDFPRVSAGDEVSFKAESGDMANVLLRRLSSGPNFIIELNAAKHISFENLAFESLNGRCYRFDCGQLTY